MSGPLAELADAIQRVRDNVMEVYKSSLDGEEVSEEYTSSLRTIRDNSWLFLVLFMIVCLLLVVYDLFRARDPFDALTYAGQKVLGASKGCGFGLFGSCEAVQASTFDPVERIVPKEAISRYRTIKSL